MNRSLEVEPLTRTRLPRGLLPDGNTQVAVRNDHIDEMASKQSLAKC